MKINFLTFLITFAILIASCKAKKGNKIDNKTNNKELSNKNDHYRQFKPFLGKFKLVEVFSTSSSESRRFFLDKKTRIWNISPNGKDVMTYLNEKKINEKKANLEEISNLLKMPFSMNDQMVLNNYYFVNEIYGDNFSTSLYSRNVKINECNTRIKNLSINNENSICDIDKMVFSKIECAKLNLTNGKKFKITMSKKGIVVYFKNDFADYILLFQVI